MHNGKTVSVVFGTYREKESIRKAIEDFFATGFVDEVVAVDNNATAGTREEVLQTKARLVHEPRQGYGYAYRRALDEATSDYIVLIEPDGSFSARDLKRFLEKAEQYPLVVGTRTNSHFIGAGAAMGSVRRLGNVAWAKILQILFSAPPITDIGCTYKLLQRQTWERLRPTMQTTNPLFATELLIRAAQLHIPYTEIPVHFTKRVGVSGIVPRWQDWFTWGVKVGMFILRERFIA